MRLLVAIPLLALIGCASVPTAPIIVESDISVAARPLLEDLSKPEYWQSRCLLPPLFANNKRFIAASRDRAFRRGDQLVAIDGEVLDASKNRAAHEILEKIPATSTVTVRLVSNGKERNVVAACGDSKTYYAIVRAAATAAIRNDARTCALQMEAALLQHSLGDVWLGLRHDCMVKAGLLSGRASKIDFYEVFRQHILQAQFSSVDLQLARVPTQIAARKLWDAGAADLANRLTRDYESAERAMANQSLKYNGAYIRS